MYESADIVAYLAKSYGDGTVPAGLDWPVAPALLGFALLPRLGRGSKYHRSRVTADTKPLTLWAYEASPFCVVVREALCELEIPHLLKTAARGSPKRQQLLEQTGTFQVPYLEECVRRNARSFDRLRSRALPCPRVVPTRARRCSSPNSLSSTSTQPTQSRSRSADKRALERCRFALQMPWKSLASPRSGLHVIQAAAARALRERHRHCIGIRQPSESPNAVRSCRKRAWPYDLPYCLRGSRPLGGARPTRLLLRASPAHPALAHARRGRCLCAALALARAATACAASHGGRP